MTEASPTAAVKPHRPEPWTPGPWFVSEDPRDGMEWNRHIATDEAGENRICFMANGRDERDEEFAANARLIAAAPDLRLALSALVGWYETDPTNIGAVYAANHARKVLAKIEAA